jgi:hypothetical protein
MTFEVVMAVSMMLVLSWVLGSCGFEIMPAFWENMLSPSLALKPHGNNAQDKTNIKRLSVLIKHRVYQGHQIYQLNTILSCLTYLPSPPFYLF